MALLAYTAIDRAGKEFRGEKTVKDKEDLRNTLRSEGLLLLNAEDPAEEKYSFDFLKKISTKVEALFGVSLFDRLVFSRNLSVMIHSGLPLTRSLGAIAEEVRNKRFKVIIREVSESVMKGKTFAESLSIHKDIFGDLYIHMVQSGEMSGKLDQVLLLLARQMKKDYDLRSRVRGAMLYPGIILCVLMIIGALMMTYVVPTLAQALSDLNVELPLTTRAIIFMSDIFVNYALFVLLGLIVALFLFFKFIRSEIGKPLWDAFVLRIPVFGSLIRKMNTARITRILAYLLSSGIPILRSLEIVSDVVGNYHFHQSLVSLRAEVARGNTLGAFFHSHSSLYDPLVSEMVSAGEETGKISELLLEVAVFFEQEIGETTKNLSSVIEPFLMVVIGIVVGVFALSILQPIYGSLGGI